MKPIATSILQYLDHLQDVDYLAQIVNSESTAKLCNIIDVLLRSESNDTVSSTCLFIRDLVLCSSRHPDCERFAQDYVGSSIVATLEDLLFSPNHFIRGQAVYTLGKTCSYSSIAAFNQAFSVFRDTDPILLPKLIGEMVWLGSVNLWSLLDSMIRSPVYVTRWAVIAVLYGLGGNARGQDDFFQGKLRCIEQLRHDSISLIQSEAEYEYQALKFSNELYNSPKAERKKRWKELERQYKPAFQFERISHMFTNYLCARGLVQYSLDELEAFISNTIESSSEA